MFISRCLVHVMSVCFCIMCLHVLGRVMTETLFSVSPHLGLCDDCVGPWEGPCVDSWETPPCWFVAWSWPRRDSFAIILHSWLPGTAITSKKRIFSFATRPFKFLFTSPSRANNMVCDVVRLENWLAGQRPQNHTYRKPLFLFLSQHPTGPL